MIGGWEMTVVGTTTVFLALSLLVAVLSIVARLIEGRTATPAPAKPKEPAPPQGARPPAGNDPDLLAIAVAAYGAHRRRRVVVRPPSEASAWRLRGRSEQLRRWR